MKYNKEIKEFIIKNDLPLVHIIRFKSSDQGTQGYLFFNTFQCCTLELPWKNNQRSISCIPHGYYLMKPYLFRGKYPSYHILDVPNRSNILIHQGNFAGDVSKGYLSNVEGCILVGRYFGIMRNQLAVLVSRPTISDLVEYLGFEGIFGLKITETIEITKSKEEFLG